MKRKKTCVLAIDDDIRLLRMMQLILEAEAYRVLIAPDGQKALDIFNLEIPDLVLLDIMMPGMDGYTVCQRIREVSQTPIIMVTAKDSVEEKVKGLNAGADDYIVKPFAASELVARVKAVLRRSNLWDESPEPIFHCQDIEIDFARRWVSVGGRDADLTAIEYRLLSYLARHAGMILTPDQILEAVWNAEYVGEHHTLQVNIARLRRKLGDNARNPKYILNKQGIGYMMLKDTQS